MATARISWALSQRFFWYFTSLIAVISLWQVLNLFSTIIDLLCSFLSLSPPIDRRTLHRQICRTKVLGKCWQSLLQLALLARTLHTTARYMGTLYSRLTPVHVQTPKTHTPRTTGRTSSCKTRHNCWPRGSDDPSWRHICRMWSSDASKVTSRCDTFCTRDSAHSLGILRPCKCSFLARGMWEVYLDRLLWIRCYAFVWFFTRRLNAAFAFKAIPCLQTKNITYFWARRNLRRLSWWFISEADFEESGFLG